MSNLTNDSESEQDQTNNNYILTGNRLKETREGKGYSLKYISQQTKISLRILESIEESDFQELPNKTYLSGFLKSYCKILGLESEDTIERYLKEFDANNSTYTEKQLPESRPQVGQKQTMAFLILLILIGVIVGILNMFSNMTGENEERKFTNKEDVKLQSISASTPLAENTPSTTEQTAQSANEVTESKTPLALIKMRDKEQIEIVIKQNKKIAAEEEQLRLAKEKQVQQEVENQRVTAIAEQKKIEVLAQEKKAQELKLEKERSEKEKLDAINEKKKTIAAKLEQEKLEKQKLAAIAQEKKEASLKAEKEKLRLAEEKKNNEQEKLKKVAESDSEKKIEFTEFEMPLYQFDTVDIADIPDVELPKKYKQSLIQGKQNVFINALHGDTWITYKSDESKVKKFVLKKGRRLLVRGDIIRIFMGNVNAAKMFLNNRPLIIKTTSGVRSLVFPQEQASNYKIPLFIYKKDGTATTSSE